MLSPYFLSLVLLLPYCYTAPAQQPRVDKTAAEILGNPAYTAISYGGFRQLSRTEVPTVAEIKEDIKLLAALDIKVLRTYNTQQFEHAARVLEAIRELKKEDPSFEMYVMLGAWIDCENAWTATPNHNAENVAGNTAEINAAVRMANAYPDIVKIIAVGNEAMVHWAASYYVAPGIILKWVNYLQDLKQRGALPADLWITSSDNFASWGGGDGSYHLPDLNGFNGKASTVFLNGHQHIFCHVFSSYHMVGQHCREYVFVFSHQQLVYCSGRKRVESSIDGCEYSERTIAG